VHFDVVGYFALVAHRESNLQIQLKKVFPHPVPQ
jgi:hypothetical protein